MMSNSEIVQTRKSSSAGQSGPVRLADIASLAGVSLSTASRVMNRRKFHELLSPKTVEKVRKAAEKLHYQPHYVAQTLATNRSMVIGVYVHAGRELVEGEHGLVGASFAGELIAYAEQFFRSKGYDLLLINLSDPQQSLERCAAKFHSRQVDGILVVQCPESRELRYLGEQGVPVVAVDYVGPKVPVSYVGLDDVVAISRVVDHLVDLGHRNIAFLGCCHPAQGFDFQARREGFLRGMERHGLAVRHDLNWPNTPRIERRPDFMFREGAWAVDHLLGRPERSTALVTVSDQQAFGATRRLLELDRRCPRDLSVVGFDDGIWARWSLPELTTISHDTQHMTTRCCEILLEQIGRWYDGQAWPLRQETIQGTLVVRGSTAPPSEK